MRIVDGQMIDEANITTSGRAESHLNCGHVKQSRYAHEVTASALYCLMHKGYNLEGGEFSEFTREGERRPQLKFWSTILGLELLLFDFVKSFRCGDFFLYKNTLRKVLPWLFALDRINYSRWVPIHLRDLDLLEDQHPGLYHEFASGKFAVHNSKIYIFWNINRSSS